MSDSNQFKIILLTNDERQQKRFKEIFEKVDVQAIFTHDLDQFWHMANVEDCDLCLVDVRQMSSGNRTLKNHPRVVNNELPLGFFYANGSQALVFSTYDFNHFGLINSSMSLAGQLKSILLRVEKSQSVQNTIKSFEYDKIKAEKTTKKFIEENESLKAKAFYHGMLESVTAQMKGLWKDVDFYQSTSNYLQQINFVKRFSFYVLNHAGNKLISPSLDQDKYEKLPSIWMDQACENGIHMVGQNKSNQIAIDLWGANFIQVHFFDAHDNPVALGLFEVEEEFVEKFNWIEFENRLNSQFTRHLLNRKLSQVTIDNELNSFELLEYIRKKNANLNKDHRLLKEINFNAIFRTATQKDSVSFSWKNFYQEYFRPLMAQFNFDYKVCYFSGEKVYVVIPEAESDTFDFEVKAYNKKFPFWRYFEAPDQMVLSDLTPKAQSRPFSILGINENYSHGTSQTAQTEREEFKPMEKKRVRTRENFCSRAPMTM
jgi:hypothetical protein